MTGWSLRRLWSALVLIAWVSGVLAPLAAGVHVDVDVETGEPAWATPHHDQTQIERVLPPVHDEHCTLCHLQRTLRHMAGESRVVVPPSSESSLRLLAVLGASQAGVDRNLPARAPPTSLTA